ncbi:unnamed protein product [Orchesella dallaii]|uniref:Odorant receptor n=1 Tax=Orchesella dallaii TaxID=48710 RepID=A0ABP1RTW3_9HEXA
MLIHGKLLKLFIRSAEDVSTFTGKIFYWDKAKLSLERNRVTFIKSCFVGAILAGLQLKYVLLNSSTILTADGNMSSETIFGIFFSICFLWNIHYLFSMAMIGVEFQTFINSAYRFEQANAHEMRIALNEKSNRRILKLTRFYLFLMHYLGTRISTIFIAFLSVAAPTLPLNFLSFPPGKYMADAFVFVSTSCDICGPLHYVFLSITFFLNWFGWICLIKHGIVNLNQIMIGSASLAVYVSIIKRKLRMGINGTTYCIENSTDAALRTYRQVQILVDNFNRAHSSLLVSLHVMVLTTLVLSTVCIMKAWSAGRFTAPGYLYLNCFFADTNVHVVVVLLSVYGLCRSVHHDANETVGQMKRAALFCGAKQARIACRCMNALPVLKIEFGGTNFVEKRTPIVYMEFALERIIDGLLLSKK